MNNATQKIPPGYKQTEVGVIPKDWDVGRLDKYFSISAGRDLVKESYSEVKDDQHAFPIYSNSLEKKGLYGFTKLPRYKKNSITITARGSIGKANARNAEFDAIGRLLILEPKQRLNCFFVSEYLNNKVSFSIESTGVPQLTAPQASKYLLIFPHLQEQTVIAQVLSDTDELIEKLDKLIDKKKKIKQGTMQELLTGKRRLPGFSGEWEKKRLGKLLNYEQPTKYIVKGTEYNNQNSTPVLTAGKSFVLGYTNEKFGVFTNLPVIIFDDFTTASHYVVFPFKVKSSAMKLLKISSRDINLRFVFEKMQLINFTLKDHKRYWISEYKNIKIEIPKPREQTVIAQVLSDIDTEIEVLEQKRDKYQEIKQAMMQVLLTGKIRLVN